MTLKAPLSWGLPQQSLKSPEFRELNYDNLARGRGKEGWGYQKRKDKDENSKDWESLYKGLFICWGSFLIGISFRRIIFWGSLKQIQEIGFPK